MFEDDKLAPLVKQTLLSLDADTKAAVVIAGDGTSAKLAAAIKINDRWQLQTYVTVAKGMAPEYGASVVWKK